MWLFDFQSSLAHGPLPRPLYYWSIPREHLHALIGWRLDHTSMLYITKMRLRFLLLENCPYEPHSQKLELLSPPAFAFPVAVGAAPLDLHPWPPVAPARVKPTTPRLAPRLAHCCRDQTLPSVPTTDSIGKRKRHQAGVNEWRIAPSKRRVHVRISLPDNGSAKGPSIEMRPLLLRQDIGQNLPAPADGISRVARPRQPVATIPRAACVPTIHRATYLPHPTLPAPQAMSGSPINERQTHYHGLAVGSTSPKMFELFPKIPMAIMS